MVTKSKKRMDNSILTRILQIYLSDFFKIKEGNVIVIQYLFPYCCTLFIRQYEFLRQAAINIFTLLTASPSTTTQTSHAGDATRNALLDIATIQQKTVYRSPPPKPITTAP